MKNLTMAGWEKGLRAVSLIELIKSHSTGSLVKAKGAVDALLAGNAVILEFSDEMKATEFQRLAEGLGARFTVPAPP